LAVGFAVGALLASLPAFADDFTVASGQTQTDANQITDGTSANAVTLTGGGTLVLSNPSNSYSGGTTVGDASTLQVTTDGNLGAASGPLTLGDATTTGTLDVSGSTTAVTSSRAITLSAGGGIITTSTSNPWTLSGVISGSGAFTVDGGGTLALTGTNTYTGGTTISGGSTVQVTTDANLGASTGGLTLGTAAVSGGAAATTGTLDLSGSTAAVTSSRTIALAGGGTIVTGANPWTLSGVISGAGALTLTGGGSIVLSGTNTFTGGLAVVDNTTLYVSGEANLSTGTVTLGDGTNRGTLNLTGTTSVETSAADFAINAGGGTIVTGPDQWTLSGVVSGAGHLTVDGTGILSLLGTNTYTGGTTVLGGATLIIAADAQLGPTGAAITLGDATTKGTLELNSSGAVTSALNISLDAGGGAIDVADHPWTISTAITGTGGLTVDGAGILILDAANTYTGDTDVTSGTLELGDATSTTASLAGNVSVSSGATLSGFGTIAGSLDNNGLVAPGSGTTLGTLKVGSYSQSSTGTLSITVTPTGSSELVVGGNASLAGALKLALDGQLHATTYQLVSAGSITGTFATVSDTLSAALGEQIVYTPTAVDLVLTQLSTLPENPTLYTAVESATIDGAQSTNTTLLSHLTGIRTGAAVDQMTMVESATHRPGASVGSTPYGAWAQAQGGFGSTSGSGSAPGYDVHGGGFIAGIDQQVGRSGVLGAAIGYDISALSENGGASATIDTPRLAVYGGYWWGPIAFDGTVGAGFPSVSAERPVQQTGTSASSSYFGTEITAAAQASSVFSFGDYAITPAVGTEYARVRTHNFSEDGAGGYDLGGPANTTQSLRPFVSTTASTRFFLDPRTVLEPTVRIAYSEEVLSNSRQVTIVPEGDDASFEFDGVKPSRGEGSIDAGLVLETNHDLGFYTNAAVVGIGNTSGVKLDAGVRYRF
jgi:autotransporter-associated beta strand protein